MIISSRCDEALDTYHRINENYHQRRVFIQDIYSKIFQNDNFTNTLIKYKQMIFFETSYVLRDGSIKDPSHFFPSYAPVAQLVEHLPCRISIRNAFRTRTELFK